jgi:hypothetical protein
MVVSTHVAPEACHGRTPHPLPGLVRSPVRFPEIRLPLSSRGLVGRVYHGLRLRREMSRHKHDGQARVSLAEAVRRL